MSSTTTVDDLGQRRRKVRAMGGEAKLKARRDQGIFNARERIELLCEPDSFAEMGEFAYSARSEDRERTPADGIVTGFGRVDGRDVADVAKEWIDANRSMIETEWQAGVR